MTPASQSTQSGRVAVVTGASSGIGAATARALAAAGYRVGLLARRTATEVFLEQLTTAGSSSAGGDIITISSVAGRTARAGNGVYAATKWALNGWSESLRQELLPGVRVTLIEPGVVATELPTHITHAETREGVGRLYDRAEVTAEDIAEVIAFTLSRPRRLAINEILVRPAGQL
jgi:NADP-dependent 3-hydroxy acid dehydrogenase YdfG